MGRRSPIAGCGNGLPDAGVGRQAGTGACRSSVPLQ